MSDNNSAAIRIQQAFHRHKISQNKFDTKNSALSNKVFLNFHERNEIFQEMFKLNKHVIASSTAHAANYELASQKFDKIQDNPRLKIEYQKILKRLFYEQPALNISDDEKNFFNMVFKNSQLQTTENLKIILKTGYRSKNLTCSELAMIMLIFINDNQNISNETKKHANVCQLAGHFFISIGDPNNEGNFIIDPWVRYLDLYEHKKYREKPAMSFASDRERGFMGRVQQYKNFLLDHPNIYVPDGTPMDIIIHQNFTKNLIGVSKKDITDDHNLGYFGWLPIPAIFYRLLFENM